MGNDNHCDWNQCLLQWLFGDQCNPHWFKVWILPTVSITCPQCAHGTIDFHCVSCGSLSSKSQKAIHLLYHYDLRISHASWLTLNWTSKAFRNVSQPAMNTTAYQVRGFAGACQPIWSKKWTYLGPVTQKFCQWTWSGIIHGHHMSHSMNLRS